MGNKFFKYLVFLLTPEDSSLWSQEKLYYFFPDNNLDKYIAKAKVFVWLGIAILLFLAIGNLN